MLHRTICFFIASLFFSSVFADDILTVHFIDVDQGDSIFIQMPDKKTMLIDAGDNNGMAEEYLNSLGVKRIDVLVATHPHLDHIGGMTSIVNNFEIDAIVMSRHLSSTKTFRIRSRTLSPDG